MFPTWNLTTFTNMNNTPGLYALHLTGLGGSCEITTYAGSPDAARKRIVAVKDITQWPLRVKLSFCCSPNAVPVLKMAYAEWEKRAKGPNFFVTMDGK